MLAYFKELYRYRELVYVLSYREIIIRYKQSVIGILWVVVKPLLMMGMFTIVFSKIARLPSEGIPYPIFSYCAVLPWTFLSTAISSATSSLPNYEYIVRRIYFPKECIPIAVIFSAFADYAVSLLIFFCMLVFYKVKIGMAVIWFPMLLLIMLLFTIGCSLAMSSVNVKYRDINTALPVFLQLWMFGSPIAYSMSMVPDNLMIIYKLNPIVGLLEGFRDIFLRNKFPDFNFLWPSIVFSFLIFVLGYTYFKSKEKYFADIL